ncbi:YciI family protein [Streptomyces tropicalis]|uniref:YciI family protein n=1 Tax=Streptomyces tropicalis TaxID=3034234 RepID=A0ABT6A9I9_9ACTN|nr:YciI family protein [Streptomyces tropicalis]MDF3301313.1 YciI family protein [Streptomyces tropicalis]
MKHYLLSVIQPSEARPPSAEALARIMGDVEDFHRALKEAGAWVFAGGLDGPETATVLRPGGAEVLITDGPYAEGKEYLGGLCLIKASDLDAALEWGRRASRATTLPIEVRPFLHTAEEQEEASR